MPAVIWRSAGRPTRQACGPCRRGCWRSGMVPPAASLRATGHPRCRRPPSPCRATSPRCSRARAEFLPKVPTQGGPAVPRLDVTATSAPCHRMAMDHGTVLLDSSLTGDARLFCRPREVVTLAPGDPDLDSAFARLQAAQDAGCWLAGFAAYELGYLLEPKLAGPLPARAAAMAGPLLSFGVSDRPAPQAEAAALLAACEAEAGDAVLERVSPALSQEAYAERFRRVREWIAAGDIYQANLTFPLAVETRADPLALYGAMRRAQPVRYGALVALDGPLLLSASPELFFEVDGEGWIETRPMKGTAARPPADRRD